VRSQTFHIVNNGAGGLLMFHSVFSFRLSELGQQPSC
jgi:hypothetical protein